MMKLFDIVALLMTLAAVFGYLNHRFIKLPTTIGLMIISIAMSLAMVILGHLGHAGLLLEQQWLGVVQGIDFNKTLMVGMLSFLLFAGALHVDLAELLGEKWAVGLYATVGVLLSTLLVGAMTYIISGWLGFGLRLPTCLLFGALISPTDPIAVLGILRRAGVPKHLQVRMSGESLFNDGIGVVVFITLYDIAFDRSTFSVTGVSLLFLEEVVGGVFLGLMLGWVAFRLLKSIDNYQVEILITLSLVTGGYALAAAVHASGPITVVVAGLLIGNHGRRFAMSKKTRQHLDMFWELIDEILNALLFVLIGIELLVITVNERYVIAGAATICVGLLARMISIAIPQFLLAPRSPFDIAGLKIMVWGGLRGGISVALALSLPLGTERDLVITMTYLVVVFSILVQGLTLERLLRSSTGKPKLT